MTAVDPAVVAVLTIACLALGEQVRALVATLLGDDTAARAGELWALHHRVEVFGTAILAGLTAVATGGLFAFGWGGAAPVRPKEWVPWRRAVVALAAPVTHLAVAGACRLAAGPIPLGQVTLLVPASGPLLVDMTLRVLVLTNLLTAVFLLLPLPSLPGGALVGLVLRDERAATWQRWSRAHRAFVGLPVAALAVTVVPDLVPRLTRFVF